jgi:hypothetical protein
LHFPLGGVNRRAGFQDGTDRQREIYTSPWALNCVPQDSIQRRYRGGSRAGLASVSGPNSAAWTVFVADESGNQVLDESGNAIEADCLFPDPTQYVYGSLPTIGATVGTAPESPKFGTLYRDRLLIVGGNGPSLVFCSRQGNHTDWNYGAAIEDEGRATIFQAAEAQEVGSAVTALVPHKDNHLLVATNGTLWVWAGDPTTGTFRNVSRNVGMVGCQAWTKIEDRIIFLAYDGLYGVNADGSDLQPLSKEQVPDELRGVALNGAMLAYSQDDRGIYIFLASPASYHWFFDTLAGRFWPFEWAALPQFTTVTEGQLTFTFSDGSVANLTGPDDEGTAIPSHVLIGPIRAASPGWFGRVLSLKGAIDPLSLGNVTWGLVPGDSAEAATEAARTAILSGKNPNNATCVAATGAFPNSTNGAAAGLSHMTYPRIRGLWFVLWLYSTTQWAYENITLELTESGKWR